MNKSIIKENYKKLSQILNLDIVSILEEKEQQYDELFEECKNILEGKKLIYGNTPMMALETVDFLSDLGLEPVFVQLRELYDQDAKFKESLLNKGYDPYISRIANIAPLRHLYDTIGADIYIGHENPMLLKQKGLTQITLDAHPQKIGYELPIAMMNDLIKLFSLEKSTMGGMMYATM
jgi:nitrogenase molybdenum-cofactor synthesis protein NifE